MPTETQEIEYRTVPIGAALLVKGILDRLGVVAAIDQGVLISTRDRSHIRQVGESGNHQPDEL